LRDWKPVTTDEICCVSNFDKKLCKGKFVAEHSGPVSVLKWKDKKEVTMISNYHGQGSRTKLTICKQEKQKPVSVIDYNERK
jgi:hypothetical protein